MLRSVMSEVAAGKPAQEHAGITEKTRPIDLARLSPARRAVSGDEFGLPRSPQRTGNCGRATKEAACPRQCPGFVEDLRRVSLIGKPPPEERPGPVQGN